MDWNGNNKKKIAEAGTVEASADSVTWLDTDESLFFRTLQGTLESWTEGRRKTIDDGSGGAVIAGPFELALAVGYYKAASDPGAPPVPWLARYYGGEPLLDANCHFPQQSRFKEQVSYLVCISSKSTDSERDSGQPMYVIGADGSGRQEISNNADPNLWYWSPDSRWLAFFETTQGEGETATSVYAWDSQSGQRIRLGSFLKDKNSRWFQSGGVTVFDNVSIDASTNTVRELLPEGTTVLDYRDGLFAYIDGAPCGGTLSFANPWTTQAFPIYTLETTLPESLVPGFHAVWDDYGAYLAFSAVTDGPGNRASISVFDRVEGTSTELFDDVKANSISLSYSHEENRLLIGFRGMDDRPVIYTANADGSDLKEMAEGTLPAYPWNRIPYYF
jgi:hypothetical protein